MGIRVLLIEDNPADALLIDVLLGEARESFDVVTVSRLSEGRRVVAQGCVDVILLDLGLPDGQGLDSLNTALGFCGDVPIIVLTGNIDESLGTEASRMGAQDYLVKGEASADAVERSILYAIERKRAQMGIRDALQSYADLVRELPSGLLTFQFEEPDRFFLLSWNPRAEEVIGEDLREGLEVGDIWPVNRVPMTDLLGVLATGDPLFLKEASFERDGGEVHLDLRAFRIPCKRLCISVDDVTERILEERLRTKAFEQINSNIEHFASLVDEIRNPSQVILGLAENKGDATSKSIILQIERIESIVNRLDHAWIASEKLRSLLKK